MATAEDGIGSNKKELEIHQEFHFDRFPTFFFLGYKTLPFPILITDAVALLVVILMNFRAVLNDVRNCEKSGSSIAVVQDALTLQNSEVTCPRSSVITSLALDWFSPKVPREKIKYAQVVDISSLPKLSTS